MIVRFTIPGPPVPKARARVVNGHAHTPERTRRYQHLVGLAASGGMALASARWPRDARYRVSIEIVPGTAHRFDVDNVGKAILDGCNRVAWDDDSQVDELTIRRLPVDRLRPRVEVEVEVLG